MYRYTQKIYSKLLINSLSLNAAAKRNAGHSKWANIKHTKALKDGQRAFMFTKLGRQMRVAIELGGSTDPKQNLKLEQVIEQAKRMRMPVATIDSIIRSAKTDKTKCKSHTLEIKGPGGCIILCEVFTDNLHATRQTIVTILKKHFSKFSDGGGIHLFQQKGLIITEPHEGQKTQDDLLETATEHAIEAGAEEVQVLEGGSLEFLSSASTFNSVQVGLEKLNYKINSASVDYVPIKLQTLNDTDLEICSNLFEKLESHPDVVKLCDNIA